MFITQNKRKEYPSKSRQVKGDNIYPTMSDSEDSALSTEAQKVCKLRSSKDFLSWKTRILSTASGKGFQRYLLQNIPICTEEDIVNKSEEIYNEDDADKRKKLKLRLDIDEKNRKLSQKAAALIISSMKTDDVNTLAQHKDNPKRLFDELSRLYGTVDEVDLPSLTKQFNNCILKSKYDSPRKWFAKLDYINERLNKIDSECKKTEKEMAVHIMNNLPLQYDSVKTIIENKEDYLEELQDIRDSI